jgi:hypothetical protein
MYARVARWEGGSTDAIRGAAGEVRARAQGGPPEGVPAVGLTLLADPQGGRVMSITLFETEADLREGDRVLNEMSPPGDGFGERQPIEMWEVAVDLRAGDPAATT